MTDSSIAIGTRDRWRPTRAGLVGLWRYWDETFEFHRGRLLLRGPNGAGKSMALELLLPFLLDADSTPSRLTSAARPRGNLYDRVMTGSDHPSRTGFAWVEFRRTDEVFTVGARMRASQSTRKVDTDYFTTTLAVGDGLDLLDEHRTPLSRAALVEAIGDTGRVHSTGQDHRNAVREVLFAEFGADRYASVIGALLALRKEKLSQNLDLAKLSEVLSDALAPIDQHDVSAVAEGFERLDRRRDELAALAREHAEVLRVAQAQEQYGRAVVLRAAADVRAAATRRDDVTRAERRANEALLATQARSDEIEATRTKDSTRRDAIDVAVEALKESEAYRSATELADLRRHADELRASAGRLARSADARAVEYRAAGEELEGAVAEVGSAAANLELAARELRAVVEVVGAEAARAEAEQLDDPDAAERILVAWTEATRDRIAETRLALEAHERAVADRDRLDAQVASDEAARDERDAARRAAAATVADETDSYGRAVATWASDCTTIGADRVSAALPRPFDDPVAVAAGVAGLRSEIETEHASALARFDAERQNEAAARTELAEERARWASPEPVDPDPPPWRSARDGMSGAPLWRLVDVAGHGPAHRTGDDHVGPTGIDGLEAALVGAGLLDAWVQPDGRVDLGPERADVVLTAAPVGGRSLADALVVDAEAARSHGIAPEIVTGVLASVPIADRLGPEGAAGDGTQTGSVVLAADGTYRLGSAVGRGPLRPARALGAAARERHRRARLAELDAAIDEADARLAELDRRTQARQRTHDAACAELEALPSADALEAARRTFADAESRLAEAALHLERSRTARRDAEQRVRDALRALTTTADRHGVPADRDDLATLEAALGRLTATAGTWTRRRHDEQRAGAERDRAQRRADRAEQAERQARTDYAEADRRATAAEQRVDTLESTLGAEHAAVLEQIRTLEAERSEIRGRAGELEEEARRLDRQVGQLTTKVAEAASARAAADEARDAAHRGLVAALDTLGPDARIEPDGTLDTATAVLERARALAAAHDDLPSDAQAIERYSERVRERMHAAKASIGHHIDLDRAWNDGGWWDLHTQAAGVRRRVHVLAEALERQRAEGEDELAADEERLFEQTLAGSVRRALADRIRQAHALVEGVNDQLGAVVTAAGGVGVRLRWEVDPDQPEAVKAARALLLRDPADLTDEERTALQEFVRARVDQARSDLEPHAPWETRLRETLDYRAWHRFALQIAHRDWDGYQDATSRRLQRLSTGERSIALHLPMIASVAAHYADANGEPAGCPRLILLDELFAGVDAANRAQLFGTFTTWDLDAVFTSDHEWCQYASLDGIAIHHLHPPTDDEPVTSTRFTWDGRRRLIDPTAA